MTDVDEIFQAIQGLPVRERLRLVERVVHELADTSTAPSASAAPALLGLFADEPDLVDEVCRMAMEARRRDPLRTGNEDDESAP
jgi:hypothetical protein